MNFLILGWGQFKMMSCSNEAWEKSENGGNQKLRCTAIREKYKINRSRREISNARHKLFRLKFFRFFLNFGAFVSDVHDISKIQKVCQKLLKGLKFHPLFIS